jgi:hypothetical protein
VYVVVAVPVGEVVEPVPVDVAVDVVAVDEVETVVVVELGFSIQLKTAVLPPSSIDKEALNRSPHLNFTVSQELLSSLQQSASISATLLLLEMAPLNSQPSLGH